jgi:Fe2+ or Zn2+ uptake regulation protein
VIEFLSEIMEQGEKTVVEEHGFRMESHHFEIYGLCSECQSETD